MQSFLSFDAICYWQLLKKRYRAKGGPLWGPVLLGDGGRTVTEWRHLSGCAWKARFVPERQGWASNLVRQSGFLSSLTQSTGAGAAGQLSDCFLLSISKSFLKKAGTSMQTDDIVALWNSLTKIIETVFSIFEIWRLWSAACAKMGWGKRQGENARFLLIKMIDYYSVW